MNTYKRHKKNIQKKIIVYAFVMNLYSKEVYFDSSTYQFVYTIHPTHTGITSIEHNGIQSLINIIHLKLKCSGTRPSFVNKMRREIQNTRFSEALTDGHDNN